MLFSVKKKTPQVNEETVVNAEIEITAPQEIEDDSSWGTFWGIINCSRIATRLLGPFETQDLAMSRLDKEIRKLMDDLNTELIPDEDTAGVYELFDEVLVCRVKINIEKYYEFDDDEEDE